MPNKLVNSVFALCLGIVVWCMMPAIEDLLIHVPRWLLSPMVADMERSLNLSPEDHYILANEYLHGYWIYKNNTAAVEHFEAASKGGVVDATLQLARLFGGAQLSKGDFVVEQNDTRSFELFLAAAEAGSLNGEAMIGVYYAEGIGVKRDTDLAIKWLKQAALRGDVESMRILGNIYILRKNDTYWNLGVSWIRQYAWNVIFGRETTDKAVTEKADSIRKTFPPSKWSSKLTEHLVKLLSEQVSQDTARYMEDVNSIFVNLREQAVRELAILQGTPIDKIDGNYTARVEALRNIINITSVNITTHA